MTIICCLTDIRRFNKQASCSPEPRSKRISMPVPAGLTRDACAKKCELLVTAAENVVMSLNCFQSKGVYVSKAFLVLRLWSRSTFRPNVGPEIPKAGHTPLSHAAQSIRWSTQRVGYSDLLHNTSPKAKGKRPIRTAGDGPSNAGGDQGSCPQSYPIHTRTCCRRPPDPVSPNYLTRARCPIPVVVRIDG